MESLAEWIAKNIWFGMLWLMRRNWMRKLHSIALGSLPKSARNAILHQMNRQDRFALRNGRMILKFAILVLLSSLAISIAFEIFWLCYLHGVFIHPENSQSLQSYNFLVPMLFN